MTFNPALLNQQLVTPAAAGIAANPSAGVSLTAANLISAFEGN
jgi:hypothetical protein